METSSVSGEIDKDVLLNVPVMLTVEVGRTRMTLAELLDTREGSIIELDRLIDQPLDILVNDARVAEGVVVMSDDKFGIQITDVVSPGDRASQFAADTSDGAAGDPAAGDPASGDPAAGGPAAADDPAPEPGD